MLMHVLAFYMNAHISMLGYGNVHIEGELLLIRYYTCLLH